MSTPALRQVILALKALLETAGTGAGIIIDRPTSDPLSDGEMPAVVIRPVEFQFEFLMGSNECEHQGALDLDLYIRATSSQTIDSQHSSMVSAIIKALETDPTLGGRVQILEPRTLTASEDSTPDLGVAVLSFELRFFTLRGDWDVLIGPGGTFT